MKKLIATLLIHADNITEEEIEVFLPENQEEFLSKNDRLVNAITEVYFLGKDYGVESFALSVWETDSVSSQFHPDTKFLDASDAEEILEGIFLNIRTFFYSI